MSHAPFGIIRDDAPGLTFGVVHPPEQPSLRLLESPLPTIAEPDHLRIATAELLDMPLRHAILAARQALLARQEPHGGWHEARPITRLTALRLLVELVAPREFTDQQEETESLIVPACRWLLATQLADGGWSEELLGQFDLNASVLAYLALRLNGHEPWEEPLQSACAAIRRAGGADATDDINRGWLAALGQIPWTRSLKHLRYEQSHSAADSQPELLIRELFLNPPSNWPKPHARESNKAESTCWQMLHDATLKPPEVAAGAVKIEEDQLAWSNRETTAATTAAVLAALRASGLSTTNEAYQQGIHALETELADSSNFARWLAAFRATEQLSDTPASLPPELSLRDDQADKLSITDHESPEESQPEQQALPLPTDNARRLKKLVGSPLTSWRRRCSATDLAAALHDAGSGGLTENDRPVRTAVARLTRLQQADGRWLEQGESHGTTCRAITALAAVGVDRDSPAIQAAAYWLAARQNASGGWSGNESAEHAPAIVAPQPTAEALNALLVAGHGDSQAADRGVQYLVATQSLDGEWADDQLSTTSKALLGLSCWATGKRTTVKDSSLEELRLLTNDSSDKARAEPIG